MVLLRRWALPVRRRRRRARTRCTLLPWLRRRLARLALRTGLVMAVLVRVRPILVSAIRVISRRIKRPESVIIAAVHVIVAPLICRRSVALVRRWTAPSVRRRKRTESLVVSAIHIVVRRTVCRRRSYTCFFGRHRW